MRCTCQAAEWDHHHAFGGVYPCEGFTECRRCRDNDRRLWSDEPEGSAPSGNPGMDHVRRLYGRRTARILYGRGDNDLLED